MDDAAQALARKLNWEPPAHDGYPGSIPDHARGAWRRFAEIAGRAISWRKVDAAAWCAQHAAKEAPDLEAMSEGQHLLLAQHDWHGWPDPPEWAVYIIEGEPPQPVCLGCIDTWPELWRTDEED